MDAANATALVDGGYAALRYLRHLTIAIDDTLRVPCKIIPVRNAIILSAGRDHDFGQYLEAGMRQLLGGHTVVQLPDGSVGLSPRAAVGADGWAPALPGENEPPRLRLV